MRASILVAVALSAAVGWGAPSLAVAKVDTGAVAPATVLQSVIDGKVQKYDLQAAAAKRPVVFYFFPKAFTTG